MRAATRRSLCWTLLLAIGLMSSGGCAFGPHALQRSHGRYLESVQRVDEEQLLRNLIRMRYNEGNAGLDVTSIAAQYELSGSAEARPFFGTEALGEVFRSFSTVLPQAQVGAANRPTITFSPNDDGESAQRFLSPITSDTLIVLTQTSWPTSTIFRLWVERLNGVPNPSSASAPHREVMPDAGRFQRVAGLIQALEDNDQARLRIEMGAKEVGGPFPAEAITPGVAAQAAKDGLEFRPREGDKTWALVRRERRLYVELAPGVGTSPEFVELAHLLNVKPDATRFDFLISSNNAFDPLLHPDKPGTEIRLSPRSTAQVYFYLANGVEVPAEHLAAGVAPTGPLVDGAPLDWRELTRGIFEVRACRGHKPPACAYVAVPYRGYWYYIDDRDQQSKNTFALMLQLSRLDFRRQRGGAPVLTLPAGR